MLLTFFVVVLQVLYAHQQLLGSLEKYKGKGKYGCLLSIPFMAIFHTNPPHYPKKERKIHNLPPSSQLHCG